MQKDLWISTTNFISAQKPRENCHEENVRMIYTQTAQITEIGPSALEKS